MKKYTILGLALLVACATLVLFPDVASAAEEGKQYVEVDGDITNFIERAINMIIDFLARFLTLIGETVTGILDKN